MKKKLFVFLIAILLVLQSSLFVAVADTQVEAEPEVDPNPNPNGYFIFNTLLVRTTEYRNPKNYAVGNEWLFLNEVAFSVSINGDVTTEAEAKELLAKDGYLDYTVRFWDSEHFLESLERLNQRDDVIKAELIYTTEDDPNLVGIDERGNFYAAGDLLIDGNFYIKTADYKNGGELNGIPVTSIFCLYAKDDYHSYVIRMDNTVDLKEAADAFAQIEGVDEVIYNHFSFPDEWLGTRKVADVDDDGDIDSMDYVLLKRAYFGTYDIHGNQLVRCDVNRDDLIDSMDYILAKRIYFGTYSAE